MPFVAPHARVLTYDGSVAEEELVELTGEWAEEAAQGRDQAPDDGRHSRRLPATDGDDQRRD